MAVPLRASRKIDFQSVSADKHLVRHRTDSLRRACPLYTGGQGCLAARSSVRRACRTGPRAALTVHVEQDSLSFMALLRGLFWLVLFVVLAFCFVVLFEYGPRDFANGCRKEFDRVKSFVVKQTEKIQKPKKQR